MKTAAQLDESIQRFREVFWDKRSGGRPPVGVINPNVFLPIKYLRASLARAEVLPADLSADGVMTDYQFAFARPAVGCDDLIPFSAAWRAIPWLEACCGCPVRYSSGSLAPGHCVGSLADLDTMPAAAVEAWAVCLRRETERLAATAPANCWLSPTILRGPSDVLAALRGQANFFCDLYDGIETIDRAAGRINELFVALLDMHFSLVRPQRGGFGHIYGYWSPGPTVVIQEDVLGQCAPTVYRQVFQKYNARIVEHCGPHVFFHLHSTGMRHWRDVLAIPGLAGLELTVEANGPPLADLVPVLREILETSRLILFVDHGFEHLASVLRQLPTAGLYLLLRDDQVRSDDEFRSFVGNQWGRD
jgi:hypothetical protein